MTMDYDAWAPFYAEIVDDFGYSEEDDSRAAGRLQDLVSAGIAEGRIESIGTTLSRLRELLAGKVVYVFGAGPNLPEELGRIRAMNLFDETPWTEYVPEADFTLKLGPRSWKKSMVVVTADSATGPVVDAQISPGIIVTDLDGGAELQLEAARNGAILLVHAHGDNTEALERWLPEMTGMVLPTCQCAPRGDVVNFGGFTDGDRAVFAAQELGASSVTLVGFDFNTVGEKPGANAHQRSLKSRKLIWASLLIELVREKIRVIRFNQLPLY